MIRADYNVKEEYVKWCITREMYNKQAEIIWMRYLHVFGESMLKNLRWKSACTYLQKRMEYGPNRERKIRLEMRNELETWDTLYQQVEQAKCIPYVSSSKLAEVEEQFCLIVNKCKNRDSAVYETAREAYLRNDLRTLWQINDSTIYIPGKNKWKMEEEILRLQKEVQYINDYRICPYLSILEDVEEIKKMHKKLREDIRLYKYYHKHLKRKEKDCNAVFCAFSKFRDNDLIVVPNDDPLLLGKLLISLRFQV